MTPHLFVDISSHGYGHLAQTAPVLNALRKRLPDMRLTVRCGLPKAQLKRRLNGRFTHIPHASDFGLMMHSALDVDVTASMARYRAFHATFPARVAEDAIQLAQRKPHLILANVSYLTLAAAQRAKIPAWALGSLNWAEIFSPYAAAARGAAAIRAQMLDAYRGAEAFLRITPGMDMPGLGNVREVGPIARVGQDKRLFLKTALGIPSEVRLVLFAMGGLPLQLKDYLLPELAQVKWIGPQASGLQGSHIIALESFTLDFTDLIASCDVLFTKSGYGAFAEATACGTRVLYVQRPDWAEEPFLHTWLESHNAARAISRAQFDQADFAEELADLLQTPPRAAVAPSGVDQAAELLAQRLLQAL